MPTSTVPLYAINLQYTLADSRYISINHKHNNLIDLDVWNTEVYLDKDEATKIVFDIYSYVESIYKEYTLLLTNYGKSIATARKITGIINPEIIISCDIHNKVEYTPLNKIVDPIAVLSIVILHVQLYIDLDDDDMTSIIRKVSYSNIVDDIILDRVHNE